MSNAIRTLVCVVTSEITWRNLPRYCFNHAFKLNRQRFDLAVICNGASADALTYIKSCTPDYLLTRPNLGFDLAGFDMLLKNTPTAAYDRFLLLHDDHWFENEDWFTTLSRLADSHPEIDVFSNLLDCSEGKLVEHFEIVSRVLGYGRYLEPMAPVFAQGVAGLFTQRAVTVWQQADGIPHIHNNLKNVAEICERLASFILYNAGCSFMQIPPGFQRYLKHGSHRSYCLEAPHSTYRPPYGSDVASPPIIPSAEAVKHFSHLQPPNLPIKVALITSRLDVAELLRSMPRHRLRQVCFYAVSPAVTQTKEYFQGLTANLLIINNVTTAEDTAALIANMDYVITDIPEAVLSAFALDRTVFYLPTSSEQDTRATVLASCKQVTILPDPAGLADSDIYMTIALTLLSKLVTEPDSELSSDEQSVNHEIYERIAHHPVQAKDFSFLTLLDEETPLFQDIGIETTTICNMSCPYCPNSIIGRPAAYMDDATFHAIIDSVALYAPDYSGSISPHFYGEPLIDNRLENFIRYAKNRLPESTIQLFTNGSLLNLQRFLALVDAGVKKIIISQHTPKPLPELTKTLKIINRDYPDYAKVEYFDQYHSNIKMNRGGLLAEKRAELIPLYRCNQYKALIFDVTGTAVLCCNDYLSSETFGNIHHSSVQQIWSAPHYRKVRNLLHYSFFPLSICRNCAFIG